MTGITSIITFPAIVSGPFVGLFKFSVQADRQAGKQRERETESRDIVFR